jgi:hypothetical protein
MEAKTPKKVGRSSKGSGEGKSPTITFRCRSPLLAQVHAAAQTSHRSISEEVERRLEASFAPVVDVRETIRDEFRRCREREDGPLPNMRPEDLKEWLAH